LSDLLHPGTAYDDPGLGADPTVGHLDQFVKTRQDQGGVHVNSGIPARAFALAATAVGGPSWQRVGPAWYRAMESPKLTARATFAGFARLTVAAAEDASVAAAIRDAWHTVGVTVRTGS
jgi:Zn-dependent metalloprotease